MTNRPLVALVLAFAAGILAAAFAPPLIVASLLLWVLLLVLFVVTRRRFWAGAVILVSFALLGAARYKAATFVPASDISHLAPGMVMVTGVVVSDPKVLDDLHPSLPGLESCELAVRQVTEGTDNRAVPATGSVEIRAPLLAKNDPKAGTAPQIPFAGDVLTVYGRLEIPSGPRNPGGFGYRAYLARRGVYAILTAHRPNDWQIHSSGGTGGNPWDRLASRLRQDVLDRIARVLPPERAAALSGVLLGARENLPPDLQDDFERTGTTHILATAGLHVGMIAGLIVLLLRLFRVPMRSRMLLTIAFLAFYATMAGGRPSVTRAALMAGVFLTGFLLEREPDLLNTLALAGLILLLVHAQDLFDPGFQLSFATVLTIVLLMPLVEGPLQRLRAKAASKGAGAKLMYGAAGFLGACFFLAVAAQLGAAPLVATYFNDVSTVSVLANTLAVPVVAPILALGFIAAVLSAIAPVTAGPFTLLLNALLAYLLGVIRWCSALPFASLSIAPPPVPLILFYYAALWGAASLLLRQDQTHHASESKIEGDNVPALSPPN